MNLKIVKVELKKTLEEALALHTKITGENFFECYENQRARLEKIIEERRHLDYMVDEKGNIYYLWLGDHGERILNKLSLHSMVSGGGCGLVTVIQREEIKKGCISIVTPQQYNFSRCNKNRKLWGSEAFPKTAAMTTLRF